MECIQTVGILKCIMSVFQCCTSVSLPQTTNSRHMWTHPIPPSYPLTLTFTLPPHIVTADPLTAVSRIRVWNYNRNMHVS